MKILDCTLRDGGYYTNWDFNSKIVDAYILAMNELPIDYLEVGYRNKPSKEYMGKIWIYSCICFKTFKEYIHKKNSNNAK